MRADDRTDIQRIPDRIVFKQTVGALLMSVGSVQIMKEYYGLPDLILLFAVVLSIFLYGLFIKNGDHHKPYNSYFQLSVVPIIAVGTYCYFVLKFGFFDLSAIAVHLQLGLDAPDVVHSYFLEAFNIALGVALFIAGNAILVRNNSKYRGFERIVSLFFFAALTFWIVSNSNLLAQDNNVRLADLYREPTPLSSDSAPLKNFIHVYLESTEGTYFDESQFGDTMAPLKPLVSRGLNATNMVQIHNTGWSSAGMTAANCGVPLSPIGLVAFNNFDWLDEFLPSAVCLGDILNKKGYQLSFILGANARFSGVDHLYIKHGFDDVLDLDHFKRSYRNDPMALARSKQDWGLQDDIVFDAALEVLRAQNAMAAPFGLVIETIGGHAPDGFLSPRCFNQTDIMAIEINVLRAVKCSNWLLAQFLAAAERDGLLENTIVVVQSDHLSMKNSIYSQLTSRKRRNLFFLFGEGIEARSHTNKVSPVDVYPTLLEAVGVRLPDSRAGLGVSMLSKRKSWIDIHGEALFNAMIRSDRELNARLWTRSDAKSVADAPAISDASTGNTN